MQPQERRARPRRQRHKVRVTLDNQDNRSSGWVIDRSRSGLSLEVEDDIKVGSQLTVRPISAPEKMDGVEVVVKNRRRRDKGFILHCSFVEAPSLVKLLLFG
jgi:hypothetical protein